MNFRLVGVLVSIILIVNCVPSYSVESISGWEKDFLLWWGHSKIDDKYLIRVIQSFVQQNSIKIDYQKPSDSVHKIPLWLKNTVSYWSEGKINDQELLNCVEYLVNRQIIDPRIATDYEKRVNWDGEKLFIKKFAYEKDFDKTDMNKPPTQVFFELIPENHQLYEQIGLFNTDQKAAVIIPTFTFSAYTSPGFYNFYKKQCDESCLTVKIQTQFNSYSSSEQGVKILELMGYKLLTDSQVDKNPEILKNYDKIIVLHNEYVTEKEFNAITSHPKVVYLYPNALYAKINVDYTKNEMTLLRGHGFPSSDIANGFSWQYDNSKFEYDKDCNDYEFQKIPNGIMLNCYPEIEIISNPEILKTIKEF